MAIQNFLSGGYYGKLGATVGQRWKNKRTIRTYVVPTNPRTPTQQANRSKFADAVTFAQMGMQMNYYCTLFDDTNFTRWNYRMKVARELKNAGLSGLDLIPLYPVSFNPPILLTEFTKMTVTGTKHISFSAPDLALNTDRVLSLMFALYDEQDTFLGYKLYLGYYYASNPGYVEVDVDNATEINEHCFVRVISNDDEDSTTDLIGSPRLAVGGGTIDVHTFDKTIRDVQKSTTGITITFTEPWKGVPTTNEINFNLVCVVNGEVVTLNGSGYTLFNSNGYCAVTFEHASSEGQMIPAFPTGSSITNLTVNYSGTSWEITIEGATESYSDSDLTRSITSTPTWNASSTGDIEFTIPFGGTVATLTKNFDMVCSGRVSLRTPESQSFTVVGNGTNLVFTCTGSRKNYPMMNTGDQISVTAQNFVCNGVTYNLPAQDIALRNAITTSYFFEELSWAFSRDGGTDSSNPLEYLLMESRIRDASHTAVVETTSANFTYVEVIPDEYDCIPTSSEYSLTTLGIDLLVEFRDNYSESEHNDEVQSSNIVYGVNVPSLSVDGVIYTFHESWMASNLPETISGWEVL